MDWVRTNISDFDSIGLVFLRKVNGFTGFEMLEQTDRVELWTIQYSVSILLQPNLFWYSLERNFQSCRLRCGSIQSLADGLKCSETWNRHGIVYSLGWFFHAMLWHNAISQFHPRACSGDSGGVADSYYERLAYENEVGIKDQESRIEVLLEKFKTP